MKNILVFYNLYNFADKTKKYKKKKNLKETRFKIALKSIKYL